jgi:hypothetical protein
LRSVCRKGSDASGPLEIEKGSEPFYTAPMPQAKIHRSNCSFLVQQTPDGKPTIIVRLYQDTIPILQKLVIGFDLLGGTQPEQAKTVAELLNGHVLECICD